MTEPRRDNIFKLPFFALTFFIGVLTMAVGLGGRAWWLVALGVVIVAGSTYSIHAIRNHRHERLFRAPLDSWARRSDSTRRRKD
jgi:hypothetical protein